MLKIAAIGVVLLASMTGGLTLAADAPEGLRSALDELIPGRSPDKVRETPIDGLYEVTYGSQVVYFTEDGRYLVKGDLIDLERHVNLTEKARNGVRRKLMARVDEGQMIAFGPKDAEHTINVFTDVECPYCRKLHREMDQLNEHGIRVRYLLFPRAGAGSSSYKQSVDVWCADDQQRALTRAKSGQSVKDRQCEHPIEEHMALGKKVGVTGTPAIVLSDGTMIPGYQPADRLAKMLDRREGGG